MMPGLRPLRHHSLDLRHLIQDVPDFPKPGILFRDISPLLRDPDGWDEVMRQLGDLCTELKPDLIVGIESRGFIVGTALATNRKIGFVPVRKPGKLPGDVLGIDYSLEYGSDRLEIHADALQGHPRVLLVDDLLATGGTARATVELIEKAGGDLVGCGFVIELAALGGRQQLPVEIPVKSLIIYS
ncbi:Adenine phosphoribosyltransferase [Prochlorococcus marinus str. MIT 1313]|nr:Adenine phosphoribosyltransferase [Prochlorococcus marinus str. MIT 1313]KZR71605.1 Adenine phosphoribosyltransferase [Prochlorococcus marinus str. MIT 1318]KZR75949.1 Adenine phosphoribosyltransferase [Prochlorococcus marinus str. MIT 1320]CAI8265272.1 MAG: Adenine phosphoribosyltransferase [Prochlorococcus marinus str. MIT 9313]